MAEIKEFRKKRNYDDLIFMENEEFNKVLEEYENHPKLKELLTCTGQFLQKDMQILQELP